MGSCLLLASLSNIAVNLFCLSSTGDLSLASRGRLNYLGIRHQSPSCRESPPPLSSLSLVRDRDPPSDVVFVLLKIPSGVVVHCCFSQPGR